MTFEDAIEELGWSKSSQVTVLLNFIVERDMMDEFEEHLEGVVERELEDGEEADDG